MSRESIEALVERWMEDTAFRARSGPIRHGDQGHGLELSSDEWAAIRKLRLERVGRGA
jgi:hypothetical protein